MRGGTGMTELERKVLSCADEHREELFALLLKLLGFDSVSYTHLIAGDEGEGVALV